MPKLLPIVALLLSAIAALAPHTLTASPSRLPDDPLLRTQMPFLETEVSTASRLPNEAAPQIRLPASKVTFQSYRDDTWNLFMANDDTSNEIALTSDESRNLQPRLNRGGGRVVFTSARDGDFEIYSMGSDGTAVTQLTSHNEDDVFPVWSPDSSKIAFQSYRDGQPEVYVMNANGSGVTRLTDNPAYDGYPSWSPDGSKIAFMSSRPGGFRIHVMNADGSNVNQLSNQPSSIFPSWSPDGRYIAYSSDNDGDGWLETSVMNADGTDQHTVYDPYGSRDAWTSDWSPDGRYIAFTEIDFIFYQGNWYWTRADGKARDLYGGSPFYLSYDDTLWNPDWQTLDTVKPVSSLAPLPSLSPYPILVRWSGSDSGGSGLRHYDIQVMVGNSGVWEDWLMGTRESSADYLGIPGETYAFRIRAQDQVLNTEDWPAGAEVVTTIETLAPETAVDPLPPFIRSSNGVYVSWGGIDPGGTGIQSYDVQLRVGNDSWLDWYVATDRTGDTVYENLINVGDTIYFRSRAVDGAGNQEEWPAGDGDTFTTLYRWGIRGTGHDNAGTPISGVQANIEPSTFRHIADTPTGNYAAYSIDSSAPYTITWSRPGLGNLPPTVFDPDVDATKDVYLPPANNLWANGDFEAGPSTLRSGPPIITSTNAHTGQYALLMGATRFFTPPQQISNAASGFTDLQAAFDDSGNLHVVWMESQDPGTHVYYSYRNASGTWSIPQDISPGMIFAGYPKLIVSGNTVHVTFEGYEEAAPDDDNFYYTYRTVDGVWGTPYRVNGSIGSGEHQFAVASNGDVHFIWQNIDQRSMNYTRRAANGLWDASIELPFPSHSDARTDWPKIVIDAYNNAHMVWSAHYWDNGAFTRIDFATRTAAGQWVHHDSVVSSDDDEYFPLRLLIDKTNQLHLLWDDKLVETSHPLDGQLYYANYDGSSWSFPLEVNTAVNVYGGLDFISDDIGKLHLLLVGIDDGAVPSVVYRQRRTNGTWSGAATIYHYADSLYPSSPILAARDGRIYATWGVHKPNIESRQIMFTQKMGSNDWNTPIFVAPELLQSGAPSLLVDTNNLLHLIWQDGLGYSDRPTQVYYASQKLVEATADIRYEQTMTLPVTMTNPVLAYMYQLQNSLATDGVGLFVDVTDGNGTTTVAAYTADTGKWVHDWVDLSNWAGETVTIAFRLHEKAGLPLPRVYVDDVSVGSAQPDVWLTAVADGAASGQIATFTLVYGNRSGIAAPATRLTLTLPPEISYREASLTPVSLNPLVWELGMLAGESGPFTLRVTGEVAPEAVPLTTVAALAEIATAGELELLNNQVTLAVFLGKHSYLPMILKQ